MAIYTRNIHKIVLILLLSLAFSANLQATDSTYVKLKPHNTIWQNIGNDIVLFFTDFGKYITYPPHMSGKDWLIGGGALGTTALISLTDKEVNKKISRAGSGDYNHDFWDGPTVYGDLFYQSALAGGIYLTGLISGNDNLRITGRMLIESLSYSGIITLGLKFILGRQRPYITDNQYQFKGFQTKEENKSFPSGHATVAFAVSTVFAERIGTWWSRVLFYGAAGLTGYARLRNNMHWLSDVFFGGLLGFSSGWFAVHNETNRSKKNEKGGTGLSIGPAINGINLSYGF